MRFSEVFALRKKVGVNGRPYTNWEAAFDAPLRDYVAFVYRITLEDSSTYIGKKKLWVNGQSRPPSSYPRKQFKMSDWEKYRTSSEEVSAAILGGAYKAEIIYWVPSWSMAGLREIQYILNEWDLRPETSLNHQIDLPMLNRKHYLANI